MNPILFYRFSVTHKAMGSVDVFLNMDETRWYEKCQTDRERREFVAHQAWRKLWDSPAKAMLSKLCDSLGVDAVKKKFSDAIVIEQVGE